MDATDIIERLAQHYFINHNVKIQYDKEIKRDGKKYTTTTLKGLFDSGMIVKTRAINEWVEEEDGEKAVKQKWLEFCLLRHVNGDAGNICIEDFLTNEEAIRNGERVMSVYDWNIPNGEEKTIWIITEWDRSLTTVLFPSDY